jgi:putative oxidoreductase
LCAARGGTDYNPGARRLLPIRADVGERTMAAYASNTAARTASRPVVARFFAKLVALCAIVPYALVALGLRLVMARVFFIEGQRKIEGPVITLKRWFPNADVAVTLPAEINDAALQMLLAQYANLPMPPMMAAYLFTYAEFVLPICLVIGFATRFAALGLLLMTALIQFFLLPQLWWSTHVYWVAILMVLMSVGPGAVSLDALIRYFYEK